MKVFLISLWALTCTLSFHAGKSMMFSNLPSRSPASVENNLEVIGQKVMVTLGTDKKLNYIAKVDTGAESSSLHAENIKVHWVSEKKRKIPYVSFRTMDDQQNHHRFFKKVSKIDDVKNANGKMTRYYIKETISYQNREVEIDVSLTNRSDLTFKFLLGKNALKTLTLMVDPTKDVIVYENSTPRYNYTEP